MAYSATVASASLQAYGSSLALGGTYAPTCYATLVVEDPHGNYASVPPDVPYRATFRWHIGDASGIIATGVASNRTTQNSGSRPAPIGYYVAAFPWAPPIDLANHGPNATSVKIRISVEWTGSLGTATNIQNEYNATTWSIPDTVVPIVSDISLTEHSPVIPPGWPFIAGLSVLKATVDAAGAYSSTITNTRYRHLGQAQDVPAAGLALTRAGANTIRAIVTDSRGRTAQLLKELPVVAWDPPDPGPWEVQRCNAAGVPDAAGTNLRVLPAATISSIGGLNTWTLKIWTRPPGGSWTLRNTITPTGPSYATPILVGGGAIYSTTISWEVRVEVADTLQTVQGIRVVPAGAKVLDAWVTGEVAVGKLVDPAGPKTQLDGPARVYGDLTVDGQLTATGGGIPRVAAGAGTAENTWTTVTFPAGRFTAAPTLVIIGDAQYENLTATSFQVQRDGTNAAYQWIAVQD